MIVATSMIEAKGFLKKHVNAVHCSNNMSLMQRKAANVLLANAYNDLLEKDEFSIDVKTLCALMGFNSKNLSKLRDALKGLMTTAVEWGVLDNNSDIKTANWKASTLLSSAEVVNGVCYYEYSNRIKKAFYYPDIFANINLKIQSQFKSSYGLALYENCSRYKNIKQTPWLKLEEVKKILGAFGSAYDRYGNFKNRVLDVAINEVNQKADFNVSLLVKKEGKAVIAIKFEIDTTILDPIVESAKILENRTVDEKEVIIRSRLTNEFKVSPSIAERLINEHGLEFVDKKMNILASLDSYKSGQIKNVPGALVDRINNPDKYIESMTSKNLANEQQKVKTQKEARERKKQIEQERINKEYTQYIDDSVGSYLEILSEYDMDDLNGNFLNYCERNNNNLVASKFKKGDKSSPMVKAIYNRFVVDNYLQGRVMSKQEFTKNG